MRALRSVSWVEVPTIGINKLVMIKDRPDVAWDYTLLRDYVELTSRLRPVATARATAHQQQNLACNDGGIGAGGRRN